MRALVRFIFVALICTSLGLSADAAPTTKHFANRDDVSQFVTQMAEQYGFNESELSALFAHTPAMPKVIALMQPPVEPQARSWLAYRQRFVEPKRIAAGRKFMSQHSYALTQAEASYGVPREIVAAIIGVETLYGRNTGRVNTLAALSTLAFDYPARADLFRHELSEFLLLARDAKRDPRSYKSSYAGALGLPQFLPSSIRAFAVDFDSDGVIDISKNPSDAIGSVASFLNRHGWQAGAPIALMVNASGDGLVEVLANGVTPSFLPSNIEKLNLLISPVGTDETNTKPETTMLQGGCANDAHCAVACDDTPSFPEFPAALVDFTSPNAPTEYRLGYQNFYVLTRYNRSRFYAAAVMDLAAELKKP